MGPSCPVALQWLSLGASLLFCIGRGSHLIVVYYTSCLGNKLHQPRLISMRFYLRQGNSNTCTLRSSRSRWFTLCLVHFSGLEDIDLLVNTFITAEDQNYTLFNYVNEVNNEIEKLEDQTTTIKREIGRYKSGGTELDGKKSAQVSPCVVCLCKFVSHLKVRDAYVPPCCMIAIKSGVFLSFSFLSSSHPIS